EQVLKHLPNGRHLILRGQGHGALRIGCTPKLLGQFIETANAKQLDARCLDALGYVPPFVSFNGWEP
ncbi:alpha/beta hydrolase, partial [Lysobacter sp. 2RAB21]